MSLGEKESALADLTQQEFQRILVILLSPIGDTLFATPVIRALRQRYPQARLSAIAFPTNKDILQDNPDIDELHIHPVMFPLRHTVRIPPLFWALFRRGFDLTVDLCTFSMFLSRVVCHTRQRVKVNLPPLWWIKSYRHSDWAHTHAVYHYLKAVEALGIHIPEPELYLTLTEEERRFAQHALSERGVKPGDLLISVHPGGEGFHGKKKWGKEKFARVGQELIRRYEAKLVILGGADDIATARWVARQVGRGCFNVTGETSLKQTAAIIERSSLFIGNDSSPMHVAAAVGTPVVAIYGPSNVDNFHPFGVKHVVVRRSLPCAPCFHYVGSTPIWTRPWCLRCRALEELSAAEVLRAVESLLPVASQVGR